jgi:NhaA family Na+:H+ antiporter
VTAGPERLLPAPVRRSIKFLLENSLFLIGGAVAALAWANSDSVGYHHFVHHEFVMLAELHVDLQFLINDVAMALFFAIAAKEVWEALLPGGELSNPRTAATPLMATAGGVLAPALIYFAGVHLLGQSATLGCGWAIPCATDIAFSYLVARLIFGNGHPAIVFLLLLAIADDAAGLLLLAAFYPQEAMHPEWLLLTLAAIGTGLGLRRAGVKNFWWYLLVPGVLSWWSFYEPGIHAALGLVPIIPTMPGHHEDKGLFHPDEHTQKDTLSKFSSWWKNPVEVILGLFGLVNAGVVFSHVGTGTWLVLSGLLQRLK